MPATPRALLTPAMKRRGCFLAATVMLLLSVFWFAITFALVRLFEIPFSRSAGMGVAVVLSVVLLWFLGSSVRVRSLRGAVLRDYGPKPDRNTYLKKAAIYLVGGAAAGLITAFSSNAFLAITAPAYGVCLGVLNLLMASGRLQILENGIWWYSWLLPWEKLLAYRWADHATLVVTMPAQRFAAGSEIEVPCPVPPEHKPAFEEILARHASVRSAAATQ